jgi:hypothetical protein
VAHAALDSACASEVRVFVEQAIDRCAASDALDDGSASWQHGPVQKTK